MDGLDHVEHHIDDGDDSMMHNTNVTNENKRIPRVKDDKAMAAALSCYFEAILSQGLFVDAKTIPPRDSGTPCINFYITNIKISR
jgi:hypothetical protein